LGSSPAAEEAVPTWCAAMCSKSPSATAITVQELRRQSLAFLARCLAGAEGDAEVAPAAKRPRRPQAADGGAVGSTCPVGGAGADGEGPAAGQGGRAVGGTLHALCAELASIRAGEPTAADGRAGEGAPVGAARAVLARLEACEVTLEGLRSSALGRELARRFWQGNGDASIAARSRALLARWRALLQDARAGHGDGGCKPPRGLDGSTQTASSPSAPPKGRESAWEAAWVETRAAWCAQAVEAAAWCGAEHSEGIAPREAATEVGQHLRAYKAKVRLLAAVMRRRENAALRQRALAGLLDAGSLVKVDEEAFLSKERRAERQRHREEGLRSIVVKEAPLEFYDDRLTCPRGCTAGVRYAVLRDSWALPRCGGCMGHMRKDTGKLILAECAACGERWQQEGVV